MLPGGRGNDLARKLGIGHDPVAAVDMLAAGQASGGSTSREAGGARLRRDPQRRLRLRVVNEIANSTRLPLGTQVYAYGALRALWSWKPAHWEVTVDGAEHRSAGMPSPWRTLASSAAACGSCRTPRSTTGCSTSR